MAITNVQAIEAMLKTWYVDKVGSLFFRNSPVLKEIEAVRVEGKEQRYPAINSWGGAVAGDALVAEAQSAENVQNSEWIVKPGQLFSIFTYNNKEVQASLSKRGAYMKLAGNKAYAATEAFRKTLAAALYGRGYGEIAILGTAATFTDNTATTISLSDEAIIKITRGSRLVLKTSVSDATEQVVLKVTGINGNTVSVMPSNATGGAYSANATDIVAIAGSMDSNGNPLLPVGLGGWLPIVAGRTGAGWTSYIANQFMGQSRGNDVDGLCGAFVNHSGTTKKLSETIQEALRLARRRGSVADMIAVNDKDFLRLGAEINSTNMYFTATSTKAKRDASIGFNKFSAAFSTNFIDLIYDDPYIDEGVFYILDKSQIQNFTYTNTDIINDGIAANNPGKEDPMEFDNKGKEDSPYKLLIDDFITVEPASLTSNGSAVRVILNYVGTFALLNTSVFAVGLFAHADPTKLVEYSA